MSERRLQLRMMCADLVDVEWVDELGGHSRTVANLEDISAVGACLQMEREIPLRSSLRIAVAQGEFHGRVRYCVYRDFGFFVGIEFDPGVRWSQRSFRPLHMFNPQRLVTPQSMGDESTGREDGMVH